VIVKPVTKGSQARQGFDFSLSAVREGGTVRVGLEVPRKGKLQNLSAVWLAVTDANG
jgi:hypothetical protein